MKELSREEGQKTNTDVLLERSYLMNRIFPSESRDSYCEMAWWLDREARERQAKKNLMKETPLSIFLSLPIHLSDVGPGAWDTRLREKKTHHFWHNPALHARIIVNSKEV